MEDMILLGQLQIKSKFDYQHILSCHLQTQYGEMAKLTVSCEVDFSEAYGALCGMQEEPIELTGQDEEGREESLFSGLIERAELKSVGRYAVLTLQAVSGLWRMDRRRKSRSFQDISRTYRDITEEIAKEYDIRVRWNLPDREIPCPLIQYQETDYEFIRRIVSHLGGRILSSDYGNRKEINIGLPQGSPVQIDTAQHKYEEVLYRKQERPSVKDKKTGYRIYGREFLHVGESVAVSGRIYGVMACEVSFDHNGIETCISAYPKECFPADKIPAERLKGVVIAGEVLETKGEVLRLHLDIDETQDTATAYDYPWRPITGNMLYCMPEKGTKAALYFDKDNEENAKAIYNLRENGERCGDLADYNNRYFTTDHGKRLYMKPGEMGLVHKEDQNAQIDLTDGSMVRMETVNKISILAQGQVQFQAKSVTVTAPKEITLVRKDLSKPTVINLCNAFDAIGCTGNFMAAPPTVAEKKKKAPSGSGGSAALPEQREETYELEGAVLPILSNIPAEDYGSALMEAAAGSMPILTKITSEK